MGQSMIEQPDGIIITISKDQLVNGYKHWLTNFLDAMASSIQTDICYCLRVANEPKQNVQFVYLCLGGKIRYRGYYGGSSGPREITFTDGRVISGKAWIYIGGPVKRAPSPVIRKGFQGFRYTKKIF